MVELFVAQVRQLLEHVRDLFGVPAAVVSTVGPDSAGQNILASWSGGASEGQSAGSAAVSGHHGALGDVDAALNALTQEVAEQTADRRRQVESLLAQLDGDAQSLAQEPQSIELRTAVLHAVGEYLSRAEQVVINHADSIPGIQRQMRAILDQYTELAGNPGTVS